MNILLVGDGDLSFGVSLVKLQSAQQTLNDNSILSDHKDSISATSSSLTICNNPNNPNSLNDNSNRNFASESITTLVVTTYDDAETLRRKYTNAAANIDFLTNFPAKTNQNNQSPIAEAEARGSDINIDHIHHNVHGVHVTHLDRPYNEQEREEDKENQENLKIYVAHGVDARDLKSTLPAHLQNLKYDRIIFNHPLLPLTKTHQERLARPDNNIANRELLADFLQSSSKLLKQNSDPVPTEGGGGGKMAGKSEIHITSKSCFPYSYWHIHLLGGSLYDVSMSPFDKNMYPGYELSKVDILTNQNEKHYSKQHFGAKIGNEIGGAITYKFSLCSQSREIDHFNHKNPSDHVKNGHMSREDQCEIEIANGKRGDHDRTTADDDDAAAESRESHEYSKLILITDLQGQRRELKLSLIRQRVIKSELNPECPAADDEHVSGVNNNSNIPSKSREHEQQAEADHKMKSSSSSSYELDISKSNYLKRKLSLNFAFQFISLPPITWSTYCHLCQVQMTPHDIAKHHTGKRHKKHQIAAENWQNYLY